MNNKKSNTVNNIKFGIKKLNKTEYIGRKIIKRNLKAFNELAKWK